MKIQDQLTMLADSIEGEVFQDEAIRTIYATDASVYQAMPTAVVYPKNAMDIQRVVRFVQKNNIAVIPRAAGTSLAGQVVGQGLILDISKYMNKILEINAQEQWVLVEPGVIRDELNHFLKDYGLHFGPITATANRAMIGGMVGNNSCGQTSIVYGSTRDHTLELHCILSDGSEAFFGDISADEFHAKCQLPNLEGDCYRHLHSILSEEQNRQLIFQRFPKPEITRRNTGYAIDALMDTEVYGSKNKPFNFCKMLCGSEGTLAITTKIKLHVDQLPPPAVAVVAVHFKDIISAMRGAQVAMQFKPTACELMDRIILDCTKENREQSKNRFFVEGDPAGIVLVEFRDEDESKVDQLTGAFITHCQSSHIGYAHPVITGPKTQQVWALRKAGLGLLANIPGDKKAVACIEDTAVALADLPDYIEEFTAMMASYGQEAVYYAHVGHAELHLRPILNLKDAKDRALFREISHSSAQLVKKYQGSLSGEHGDGRARAEFIPLLYGEKIYNLFKSIKNTWDPQGIFNPQKIVDAPPMNTDLRYQENQQTPEFQTLLDYSHEGGILRAAEKCNGSGDCRKLPLSGGTMCPSYQATRNEKETTRARANTLRNYLSKNTQPNPFDHTEIKEVLDLCLSCKGCTSECPSNVDMAGMKAEFTYQYHKSHPVPLASRVFANIDYINKITQPFSSVYNQVVKKDWLTYLLRKWLNIAPERSFPRLSNITLRQWYARNEGKQQVLPNASHVYLFCDEFTNRMESEIGIKSILLLNALGYRVNLIAHPESGRAAISKGLLGKAKKCAEQSVEIFRNLISPECPLIGIEPSAILSFVDEYPRLVRKELKEDAEHIAKNAMLIDEFIYRIMDQGSVGQDIFTDSPKKILLHAHCHQKSLSDSAFSAWILSWPANYEVETIPSGCCGMAGSFGYDKGKYKVSMQVGELVLFPTIRNHPEATIAATGTSCRHQISDGVERKAYHPVEILYDALKK